MDPLAHYFGKNAYEQRKREDLIASHMKTLVNLIPYWVSVVEYDKMIGEATCEINQEFQEEVLRRLKTDYRFDEFFIETVCTLTTITVKWSWCPIEVRVLPLVQILPEDIVARVYTFSDTSRLKAECMFDQIFLTMPPVNRPFAILDDCMVYWRDGSNRYIKISLQVRARLLELVHQ